MRTGYVGRSYSQLDTTTISVRFTADEIEEIDSLKEGWGTRGQVIRDALALALKTKADADAAAKADKKKPARSPK